MTLTEVDRLYAYWRRNPHEHRVAIWRLMAATTWKPPEKPKPFAESSQEEITNFARALGAFVN